MFGGLELTNIILETGQIITAKLYCEQFQTAFFDQLKEIGILTG